MKERPVDTTNKKNIYCAHCEYYCPEFVHNCTKKNEHKHYWNRCKSFEWAKRLLKK